MLRHLIPAFLSLSLITACATPQSHAPQIDEDACGIVRSQVEDELNPELEACAAAGDVRALAYLGMLYLGASDSSSPESYGFGAGIAPAELLAEGRRLIELAAERGNAEAQNELGLAYFRGDFGYEINTDLAFDWLSAATEGGDNIAPLNLARMYFSGRGVALSTRDGERYLRLSAERKYKPGRCSLAYWLDRGADAARQAEARALREAAARSDDGYECSDFDVIEELFVSELSDSI